MTAEDLTFQQATAALDWCASFHATFVGLNGAACSSSNCPNRNHDQLRGLWQVGGFWSLDRKEGMLPTMEKTYSDELRSRVYKELPTLKGNVGVANLAKRLHAAARPLRERLSSSCNNPSWYTLIHGDLKGANIALPTSCGSESASAAVFDFQWTGGGLPVVDLA